MDHPLQPKPFKKPTTLKTTCHPTPMSKIPKYSEFLIVSAPVPINFNDKLDMVEVRRIKNPNFVTNDLYRYDNNLNLDSLMGVEGSGGGSSQGVTAGQPQAQVEAQAHAQAQAAHAAQIQANQTDLFMYNQSQMAQNLPQNLIFNQNYLDFKGGTFF